MGKGKYPRVGARGTVEQRRRVTVQMFKGAIHAVTNEGRGEDTGRVYWYHDEQLLATADYTMRPATGDTLRLHLSFRLCIPDAPAPVTEEMGLVATCPNYGGRRWWLVCPWCGERRAALYQVGRRFVCRECPRLTYASTRERVKWNAIDKRLGAIRERLGAGGLPPGGDNFVRELYRLPPKPRGMWDRTYSALAREYLNLLEVRTLCLARGVAERAARPWPASLVRFGVAPPVRPPAPTVGEIDGAMAARWRWRKTATPPACRPRPRSRVTGAVLPSEEARGWWEELELVRLELETEERDRRRRPTLGDIAHLAGVPYEFALEAQRAGLVRADRGRGTRRRRYRRKLAAWLEKLHALRASGWSWDELRAWTRRRFLPGHEEERRYPVRSTAPTNGT